MKKLVALIIAVAVVTLFASNCFAQGGYHYNYHYGNGGPSYGSYYQGHAVGRPYYNQSGPHHGGGSSYWYNYQYTEPSSYYWYRYTLPQTVEVPDPTPPAPPAPVREEDKVWEAGNGHHYKLDYSKGYKRYVYID